MTEMFTVEINEGAFFYEPWLVDKRKKKERTYRYDKVPSHVRRAFAQYLKYKGEMNSDEARMIIEFVIEGTPAK